MKTVIKPQAWWRLPFAVAVALHGTIIRQCQLCRLHQCYWADNRNEQGCNDHWFNQLQFICEDCHAMINWQQSHFSLNNPITQQAINGIASTNYSFPYNDVMTRFKNHHELSELLPLIHAVRQLLPPLGCHANNSLIVIVPTTNKRLAERGFDPLFLLGKYLSFHWQIPLFTGLQRQERQHQQGLSKEQRLQNVQGAFSVIDMPNVRNLILFDDVVTTGATLQAVVESFCQISPNFQFFVYAVLHGR